MGWFDKFSQHDDYQESPHAAVYKERKHKSAWSEEMVGGAAGFEAMRLYEQHEKANGKAPSHKKAKEILTGIAGAEAGKLVENKGLDYMDRKKAEKQAKQQACDIYDQHYGQDDY